MHQRKAEDSDPFLWAEVLPGAKMHRIVSLQYVKSVMSQRIVCEWVESFKNGPTSVKHEEGTGSQSTSITDADMERIYGMIQQNIHVTGDEVVHQLHRFTTD